MAKTSILSIRIVSDADSKGFKKAAAEVQKLNLGVAKFGAKFAAVGTGITAVSGAAVGAIGSLGVGLVGIGALAGPALAPIALGMDGIKAAAASVAPQFTALKTAISAAAQGSMTAGFKELGGLMTSLQPALVGLTGTLGHAFSQMAAGINQPAIKRGLTDLIGASGQLFSGFMQGIPTLVQGIGSIGTAIAPVAGQLGQSLGGILASFGDAFTKLQASGELTTFFQNFTQVLQPLGGIVGALVPLLVQAGSAMSGGLGSALSAVTPMLQSLTGPLTTVAGVMGGALATAMQGIAQLVAALAPAFASLITAIAPLVPPLVQLAVTLGQALAAAIQAVAPFIAELATQLGGILTEALQTIQPYMPELSRAFTEVFSALTPLIPAVMEIVRALLPLLPPIAQLVTALLPPAARLFASLTPIVQTVAQTVAELVAELTPAIDLIGQILVSAIDALQSALTLVTPILQTLIDLIGAALGAAIDYAKGQLENVKVWVDALADAFRAVVDWVKRAIDWFKRIKPPGWLSKAGGWVMGSASMDLTPVQATTGSAYSFRSPVLAMPAPSQTVNVTVNVGGHVLQSDLDLAQTIRRALAREGILTGRSGVGRLA